MKRGALGVLALAATTSATAAQIQQLDVSRNGNRYTTRMQVTLDTSAERAYAVLSRFENLPRINPAVRSVQRIGATRADGSSLLFTRVRVCVAFFCRVLQQVQDMVPVHAPPALGMEARVRPEQSNLRYGFAQWRFRPCEDRACMSFTAELEPKFWVPPLIGPWLIQRKLREEAIETSRGIERLAQAAH